MKTRAVPEMIGPTDEMLKNAVDNCSRCGSYNVRVKCLSSGEKEIGLAETAFGVEEKRDALAEGIFADSIAFTVLLGVCPSRTKYGGSTGSPRSVDSALESSLHAMTEVFIRRDDLAGLSR